MTTDGRDPASTDAAQWDKPSDTLRRMAGAPMMAGMRECDECDHRHAVGTFCGYPEGERWACRCES